MHSYRDPRAWIVALVVLTLAVLAGCGGEDGDEDAQAGTSGGEGECVASIGHIGPLTGNAAELGQEQLHWTEFAVQRFNEENGTDFEVVEGDAMLSANEATTIAQQFVSDDDILATVGPAGSQAALATGDIFEEADFAAVSMSATNAALTTEEDFTTFFRVNGSNTTQKDVVLDVLLNKLKAQNVFVIDDQTPDKTELADLVQEALEAEGVTVQRGSITPDQRDYSNLVSQVSDETDVIFLSWQVAANGQQFGQQMAEQGIDTQLVGANGLYSPSVFKIPGAYVTSFAPDITNLEGNEELISAYRDQYGDFGTYGPPSYAAATAIMTAIQNVCESGEEPTRAAVVEQLKQLEIEDSILGYPITFNEQGDVPAASFYLFRIAEDGTYERVQP